MTGRASVYTVAPGAPFLEVVAAALLDGSLAARAPAGAFDLAAATVYLPTRRAIPALARALHRAAGKAVLLPRIASLGDIDGDDGSGWPADAGAIEFGAAVVSESERRAVLADIAMEWAASTTLWRAGGPDTGREPVPRTPVEAAQFAIELARLLDEMSVAGADRNRLAGVLPDDLSHLARNWEINLEFLTRALERWSAHLEARGLVERVVHRDRQLLAEAERLGREGAPGLVVAAGSTGSVPAAAALMRAIARLDAGAVILPGLDTGLDDEGWRLLGPDHPQWGMKALIESIGIDRSDVKVLGPPPSGGTAVRARLLSEVMRPAETADRWVAGLDALKSGGVREALSGVTLIEADDEHLEARVIALMLRRAADETDQLTALVTPDRGLARRVSAELARWRIVIDDSAGKPLADTPPAVLVRLIAEVQASDFAPVPTLALLKHPLTLLGLDPARARASARIVELLALRGARPGPGVAGLKRALDEPRPRRDRHPVIARITQAERASAHDLLARLARAFVPLTGLGGGHTPAAADLVAAHAEVAEALARSPEGGCGALWAGEAGEALSEFLAEAIAAAREARPLPAADFGGWLDQLMRGRVVRETREGPASLVIRGPLEARLQRIDRLILAGLNEGTWPAETETDPWLGRHMRRVLGLEPPERRIGLQAHDVAQGFLAPEVVLTRSMKSGGTPAVPSRWIWRLRMLLKGLGCEDAVTPAEPWLAWARGLDDGGPAEPRPPPRPTPPLEARPARLSVTRIETLIRDPYAIYAREVLKLAPLDGLDLAPDAADYGLLIHAALARLVGEFPMAPLPDDAYARLIGIGAGEFRILDSRPGLKAYWWSRFERVARWFVDDDRDRRAPGTVSHTEIGGETPVAVPNRNEPFRLTARADRIDIDEAGAATILDYKTGRPPTDKQIHEMMAPQLPLEAAMLGDGGFRGVEAATAAALIHMSLTGREPPGDARPVSGEPEKLAGDAIARLAGLVAAYARPDQPYRARVAPFREDSVGDYDHLARVGEWSIMLGRRHAD